MGEDEELLLRAQRGDREAFAAFYRRRVDAVTAFHLRRTGSREVAFDLTAETFAAVVVGLGGFDPARGSAGGWLFAIAANEQRQALRRRRVEDRARRTLALEAIAAELECSPAVVRQRVSRGLRRLRASAEGGS